MSVLDLEKTVTPSKSIDNPDKNKKNILSKSLDEHYQFSPRTWKNKPIRLKRDINISETQIIIDGQVLDIESLRPIPLPESLAGSPVKSDTEFIDSKELRTSNNPGSTGSRITSNPGSTGSRSKSNTPKIKQNTPKSREDSKPITPVSHNSSTPNKKQTPILTELVKDFLEQDTSLEGKDSKPTEQESSGDSPKTVLSAEGSPNKRVSPAKNRGSKIKAAIVDQRNSERRLFNSDNESESGKESKATPVKSQKVSTSGNSAASKTPESDGRELGLKKELNSPRSRKQKKIATTKVEGPNSEDDPELQKTNDSDESREEEKRKEEREEQKNKEEKERKKELKRKEKEKAEREEKERLEKERLEKEEKIREERRELKRREKERLDREEKIRKEREKKIEAVSTDIKTEFSLAKSRKSEPEVTLKEKKPENNLNNKQKKEKQETPASSRASSPRSTRLEDDKTIQELRRDSSKKIATKVNREEFSFIDERPKKTPTPVKIVAKKVPTPSDRNSAVFQKGPRGSVRLGKDITPNKETPKSALKTPTPSASFDIQKEYEKTPITPSKKKVSIGRVQTPIPSPNISDSASDRGITKRGKEIIRQDPDSDEDLLLVPVMIERTISNKASIKLNTPEHRKPPPIRVYSSTRSPELPRSSGQSNRISTRKIQPVFSQKETPNESDRYESESEYETKPTTIFIPTKVKESNIPFAPIIPFITAPKTSQNSSFESNKNYREGFEKGAEADKSRTNEIDIEVRKIKLKDKFQDLISSFPHRRIEPFNSNRSIEVEEARFNTEESLAKVESKVKEWQVWILLGGLAEEVFGTKVLGQNTSRFSKINVDLMNLYESSLKEIAMSESSGSIFDGIPPMIKIPLISIMLFMGLIFVRWIESKLPEGVGEPLENTAVYLLHNNAPGNENVGPTKGISDIVHGFVKAFPFLQNFLPKAEGPKVVPVDPQPDFND